MKLTKFTSVSIIILLLCACNSSKETSSVVNKIESTVTLASEFSVNETANHFENIISQKGLTQFARIDHAKNAAGVDLKLRATQLIVFGNPKVGTPLMQCSQLAALDLPQKALFWEDEAGKVWVTYNNPEYLKERHAIDGCEEVLGKIANVLKALTTAAATK